MTMDSGNTKTGNMCQVWILTENIHPVDAVHLGGMTPFVVIAHTVNSPTVHVLVMWMWVRLPLLFGSHTSVASTVSLVISTLWPRGQEDPLGRLWWSCNDLSSLAALLNEHAGHTGYTHQWSQPWAQWCKGVFQASCDSFAQYLDASAHGWKTFAVVAKGKQSFSGKLCPATADNSQAQCITCSLCDGAKTDILKFIVLRKVCHQLTWSSRLTMKLFTTLWSVTKNIFKVWQSENVFSKIREVLHWKDLDGVYV